MENKIIEFVRGFNSELENADKYVKDNEKKYSLNDIEKVLKDYLVSSFERREVKAYILKNLINGNMDVD